MVAVHRKGKKNLFGGAYTVPEIMFKPLCGYDYRDYRKVWRVKWLKLAEALRCLSEVF